jgi:PAS domain S-box-containing protein
MDSNQVITLESEAGFKALFQYATIGILIIGKEGNIELINPCAESLFGYSNAELIGQPVEVLIPDTLKYKHEHHREAYFNKPKARPMGRGLNLLARKKDGSEFPVEISLGHYRLDDENLAVAFITDITERKQAEQKLRENEERYRLIFEGIQESFTLQEVITDKTGEDVEDLLYLEINPATEKILGKTANEVVGRLRSEIVAPLDEKMKQVVKIVGLLNRSLRFEHFLPQLDRWYEIYCYSPKDKQIATFNIDITDRKNAEIALKKLNEELGDKVEERTKEISAVKNLLSDIVDNYPDGSVSVIDKEFKYIYYGGESLKLLNINPVEMLGKRAFPKLTEETWEEIKPVLLSVFKGTKVSDVEIPNTYNNQHFTFDAFPLREKDGSIEKIVIMTRNVTALKKVENELRHALQKEKDLSELKSRFVSIASHEFRTPLSAILSSVSLIDSYRKEEHIEKREKHINRIKSSVKKLLETLNDFLSIDKLEQNKVELFKEQFDFYTFSHEMIDEVQGMLKARQQIVFTYNGGNNIVQDRKILKHILLNLLSNAIKYSDVETKVYFSINVADNSVSIEIKDEGIGIPEEEQQNIFGNFFRAKNVTNIQGTGLGLSIVKNYVELMNGNIGFVSKTDIGTTFTVEFPVES